ncbi:VacJ family lipoprotein [Herbaspirillum seropedicae]|uniref:Surface lipoprotein (VacJ) transmembrane protein n=1 Tax=Herbaspirillum seropedicae (strain SmR1) TaxID=757424 RepID=D8ITB6_HERSS|nr:VacJ family lipoprotein [Herbaspirillum seropedicae]ADJ65546.1 surface lipoprotein (VacJ) transmembrane protein [Herbaspirillum seropedicae SmR1]AKN67374.1 ABC transporter [Herbaspirillum seropedicae]AON56444.1 surface lipoprotein (VacJ) transmembrane protein [Herbaspirillum seropedicae]NQE31967.1 ABC transporter [Herbaspirillum seropedicae]QDD66349.1 VacJ family lipoprotein [Herbaspirillum seropedicae]
MNNKTINAAYASRLGAIALAAAVMTGCASTSNNPNDPLEGFNRTMFSFNDTVDKVALKPAAQAYDAVVPSPVQRGVGNFFGNIGDLWSSVNQLLQGRIEQGVSTFMRVAINTTFGLGGVLDVATEARLPREKSDFGQTLGKWGVGSGPYVVLPFFGPSTLRDTAGMPVDLYGDLWTYKRPTRWRNVGTVVRIVDRRAQLLDASTLLEDAALDKYDFVRDAYLQRRQSQINGAGGSGKDRPENAIQP